MQVNIIRIVNGSAVIQWIDDESIVRKGVIPEEAVANGNVTDELLSLAIPYGMPWELILEEHMVQVTPQMLADELRKVGIWTYDELLSKFQAALGAIQAVYGVDLAILLRQAKHYMEVK